MAGTRKGYMWAQWTGKAWARNSSVYITIRPKNRIVTADAAITRFGRLRGHLERIVAGVASVVANGQYEIFDWPRPYLMRSNVTEITFELMSMTSKRADARFQINYWSNHQIIPH